MLKVPDASAGTEDKARLEKECAMEFDHKMKTFSEIKNKCRESRSNACSIPWKQCSSTMQERLLKEPDFKVTRLQDPVKMMELVSQKAHGVDPDDCSMKAVLSALRLMLSAKQGLDQDLLSHKEKFIQQKKAFEHQWGDKLIVPSLIKEAQDDACEDGTVHDPPANKIVAISMRDTECARFMAHLFMQNSDQRKCGALMASFKEWTKRDATEQSHPPTIEDACAVMKNHTYMGSSLQG